MKEARAARHPALVRPVGRALGPALAAVLALAAPALGSEAGDRLATFKELARQFADAASADAGDPLLAAMFAVVDGEVVDNLRGGGPFASPAFIQERLDAFSDEWGGVALAVTRPPGAGKTGLTVGLFAVTRAEPRASLRIYGRSGGEPSLLAAASHPGALELHRWPPAPRGMPQFLASWRGAANGSPTRSLELEIWREGGPRGVARIWSSAEAFPDGLAASEFSARDGRISVRYALRYPGWVPGCENTAEREDVYRTAVGGEGVTLISRREWNGWNRELGSALIHLFSALDRRDERALADLVPDSSLRRRLPPHLRREAICDERVPGAPATVIVAATSETEQQRVAWSLSWRRAPAGWRLVAATPVLQ